MKRLHKIDFASTIYPERLRQIACPPKALYALGNLELLSRDASVSVVGSRAASPNGLKIAIMVTEHLVANGAVIVSGLALGIDTAVHSGCLNAGGKTIAVLAHGLDMVWPPKNTDLAQDILANDGLLVSEYDPQVRPQRHFFNQRNRIQVGLSKVSLVVEAGLASGTASHAKLCVDAGHPLFVILPKKGRDLGLNSQGPRVMVVALGARPVRGASDYASLVAAVLR